PFTPGDTLTPQQIMRLLPATARAVRSLSITDAAYGAQPAPADASDAIQKALNAAAQSASADDPVDVLVPAGTFNHSQVLNVGPNVRLRRDPEDTGGILHATDPLHAAVHLSGDRSAALFLVLTNDASERAGTPDASSVWVGPRTAGGAFVHDTWLIGT